MLATLKKTAPPAAIILLCAACTTLRPVQAPREEIQRQILDAGLLKPGDRVRIVTSDGTQHDLRVSYVDSNAGLVGGEGETVRIDEIDALDKRAVSAPRTAALAAGLFFGFLFALAGVP
jgi:hypothetical protein